LREHSFLQGFLAAACLADTRVCLFFVSSSFEFSEFCIQFLSDFVRFPGRKPALRRHFPREDSREGLHSFFGEVISG